MLRGGGERAHGGGRGRRRELQRERLRAQNKHRAEQTFLSLLISYGSVFQPQKQAGFCWSTPSPDCIVQLVSREKLRGGGGGGPKEPPGDTGLYLIYRIQARCRDVSEAGTPKRNPTV